MIKVSHCWLVFHKRIVMLYGAFSVWYTRDVMDFLYVSLLYYFDHYIVVITKKPPMCQIMRFSLNCINGSIKGKHITLKNSNNTLLAMKSELHTEEFL